MSEYLNLTYKLVWFQYYDRESIDILSIFGVLSVLRRGCGVNDLQMVIDLVKGNPGFFSIIAFTRSRRAKTLSTCLCLFTLP